MQVYVGRRRALDQLLGALDEARTGRGALLLVSGEPGIGKTRFAEEANAVATESGFDVRWATCWLGEDAPAYWPWIQIFRAHAELRDPSELAQENGSGVALRTLLPGFADRLPPPVHELLPSLDAQEERFRLFNDVASFLRRASERRPMLVVMDDLHWADATSLQLLMSVASTARTSRMLIIATYREPEARSGNLGHALPDLLSQADTIALSGLTESETAELLDDVTRLSSDEALAHTVHSRSGGNPLFVRELGRLLVAQGWAADPQAGAPAVPATLFPLIEHRTALLSPGCRAVLGAAATAGAEFEIDLIAHAAQVTDDKIIEAIDEAVRLGVVVIHPRKPGAFSFVHGIVRDVVYHATPTLDRTLLHRRIAEWLERRPDAGRHHAELAQHFALAGGPTDLMRAVDHAERAAVDGLDVFAFDEAAAHAEHALEILAVIDRTNDRRRASLLLLLGEIQARAGRMAESRRTLARAAEVARLSGDSEKLARAVLGYGRSDQFTGGVGIEPRQVALAEEALAALPSSDSPLRVQLLRSLALQIVYVDPDRFRELSGTVIEMSRRLLDPDSMGAALQLRHQMLFDGADHVSERLAVATELLRLGEEHRRTEFIVYGRIWRVYNLLELGDIAAVAAEIGSFEHLIEEARLPSFRWFPALWRAMRRLLEGRISEAETLAAKALDVGEARGQGALDHFGMQLIGIRREQDRLAELIPLIRDSAERYPEIPSYRCALALAYSESGESSAARAEFERLAADRFATIPRDYSWTVCLLLLSETCAVLGDSEAAAVLYDCFLPFKGRSVVVGYAGVSGGAVDHYLGVLATAAGRHDDARHHLEAALRDHRRMGAAAWIVRTQYELGRCLADSEPERAADLLRTASTTAKELGLIAMGKRVDRVLASLGSMSHREGEVEDRDTNVFRLEGSFWTITFEGTTVHLKDAKGIRDLSRLLGLPGREIHALDLVTTPSAHGRTPLTADEGLSPGYGGSDEQLDEQARGAYRARIIELRDDLDGAEAVNDVARAERARTELDMLTAALASAYGLGGRRRRSGDPAERARKAVTERIRDSLRRISDAHSSLGRHLDRSVNTGTFCSYTPDRPISWDV
ncbi:MAG: AAA family ATPase [Actinomycetota bacterium]